MEKDLRALAMAHTPLSMREIQLLFNMAAAFPFLSDLAHGELRAYLPAKEEGQLLLAAHHYPHTFYMAENDARTGMLISTREEPLVTEVFRTGKRAHGKREWRYGAMLDMFAYPIHDGERVIGVLTFETDLLRLSIDGYDKILVAAVAVLYMARSEQPAHFFRPIAPGDGILVADAHSRIIFADAAAERIYRVLGMGSLRGYRLFERSLSHIVTQETIVRDTPWQKEVQAAGRTLIRREIVVREGGQPQLYIILISDVTEMRQKDEELRIKSAVIQEIHHRVKNNLQTIASLLRLQARRASSDDVKSALQEAVDRVLSISVVHEYLSQQGTENIDVQEVMQHIFDLVTRSMAARDFTVTTSFSGGRLILPSKCASSIALVLNELVLNSMEHGFAGRIHGQISLDVRETEEEWILVFSNDGAPIDEAILEKPRKSLGLTIIRTLMEGDLAGTFSIENLPNGAGVATTLTIPKKENLPID